MSDEPLGQVVQGIVGLMPYVPTPSSETRVTPMIEVLSYHFTNNSLLTVSDL